MKLIISFFMALSAMSLSAVAQSKEEKEVTAAVESLRRAMIDPDKTILDKLAAEELSYGHSGGQIQNKTEFMETLLSGKSDFVSIELTEQTVKVVGQTAIVRHRLSAETNDGGKPGSVKLSILLVWVKEKGGWKLLARQAVKAAS